MLSCIFIATAKSTVALTYKQLAERTSHFEKQLGISRTQVTLEQSRVKHLSVEVAQVKADRDLAMTDRDNYKRKAQEFSVTIDHLKVSERMRPKPG